MKSKLSAYLRYLFTTVLLVTLAASAQASHIVGIDLFYTWVSGNTYKVTLVAYGDCGSGSSAFTVLPTNSPVICIYNGGTSVASMNLAIQAPSAGVEITPVCPADSLLTQCTNIAYTIPGIKKFVYSANYTLPSTSATWRFVFKGDLGGSFAGRASSITNITGGSVIELEDTLNNLTSHNSNPLLTVVPTPFFCLDNSDHYNPGAVDPDGDSLSFALVSGIGVPGGSITGSTIPCDAVSGPVSYITPFTPTLPLAATTFSFDSHTGQISFLPNATQRALVVYNIEEHRGGTLVGTCQREMTFLVLACTNVPPSGSLSGASNGTIDDSIHFHICQGSGPFNINIFPTEPNPLNHIFVTASGLPTSSSFVVTGNGTSTPHCVFSWTSTGIAVGSYTFYVTYTDNNCPLAGLQTLAYTITITASPSIGFSLLSSATCLQKAFISISPGGTGYPWRIAISAAPGDTIQNFTGISLPFTDSIAPGNDTLTIITSTVPGCTKSIPLTIPYPPTLNLTGVFTSPTYCGLNNGIITIHSLVPGYHDTIKY